MSAITAAITFIITIVILVGIHEFGHYWAAKRLGVKVLRFAIGFGKVLKSWRWGETEFAICALPFGGYVKMLDKREDSVEPSEMYREFTSQNVYKRMAIVVAGPLSNLLFAVLIYTVIYTIGVSGIRPIIGTVTPDSISFTAGLESGDEITHINAAKTPTIQSVLEAVLKNSLQSNITIGVVKQTGQQTKHALTLPDDLLANPKVDIMEILGFSFATPELEAVINEVLPDSPAQSAGIQTHDKILRADGVDISHWQQWVDIIQKNADHTLEVLIERNGTSELVLLTPKKAAGDEYAKIGVSVLVPDNFGEQYRVLNQQGLFNSLQSAVIKVYDLSILTLQMMVKIVTGSASLEHISGPVSIANYASQSVQIGWMTFLGFLAIISISLGVLNLLPIPILDGGHLLYYVIEVIKGSPVSERTQAFCQRFGIVFILSLMLIAVYNDVLNLI